MLVRYVPNFPVFAVTTVASSIPLSFLTCPALSVNAEVTAGTELLNVEPVPPTVYTRPEVTKDPVVGVNTSDPTAVGFVIPKSDSTTLGRIRDSRPPRV